MAVVMTRNATVCARDWIAGEQRNAVLPRHFVSQLTKSSISPQRTVRDPTAPSFDSVPHPLSHQCILEYLNYAFPEARGLDVLAAEEGRAIDPAWLWRLTGWIQGVCLVQSDKTEAEPEP